jgi:hypothetical protein
MRLLGKLQKEATVGLGTLLEAAGVARDEEDPDFLARDGTYRAIAGSAALLLAQLCAVGASARGAAAASDAIRAGLGGADIAAAAILALADCLAREQAAGCVAPLEAFQARLGALDRVRSKRRRNRMLAAAAAGDERRRRAEKYDRFHAAFVVGTDLLAAQWPALLGAVFGRQYAGLIRFGIAVGQRVLEAAAEPPRLAPVRYPRLPAEPPAYAPEFGYDSPVLA